MQIAYNATSLLLSVSLILLPLSDRSPLAMSNEATTSRTGKLVGTVLDSHGAAIVTPRPTVIIKAVEGGAARKIEPNEEASFEVDLPTGIYQISTDIPGFYPVRRAAFHINAGETAMINLVPSPRYLVRGTTVSTKSAIDKPAPRPRYDAFSILQSSSELLNLVIQFEKKRRRNGTIEYHEAILSYDMLTIHADKLSLERKGLRVKASGNQVLVEDGKQHSLIKYIEVNFKGGKPVLDLAK